jgi:hypothetical protein
MPTRSSRKTVKKIMQQRFLIMTVAFVLTFLTQGFSQNVSINTTGDAADASAMFDISSTNRGLLIPRMTQTQRDAISSPANALLIYQTDGTRGFYYYSSFSSSWALLGGAIPGTVTSVSVTTANGVSGTVATNTTTPAISLTLGAITPISVTASGSITGSNVLSTNATDIAGKLTGNTAITGATKTKITYDTKGLVTAGGDATTTDIAEGTNLYYADSRARAAIKLTTNGTSGIATYNNNSGALNIPAYAAGTGTVTSASVVSANGISGTVATATTTPAITLSLGAITPASVAAAGIVTGSNLSGTHTGNSSGVNTGDETTATIKTKLGAATALADGYLTFADWNTFNSKAGTTNTWLTTGNAGTTFATHFLGTTDFQSLRFRTNNVQGFLLDSLGNVAIGKQPLQTEGANMEKFLVDAGSTASNPATSINVINARGYLNSYLQLNIQNKSNGELASSDLVATADNGNETMNYVDLGINSSGNASGYFGTANDAYLYNLGQNLLIGTGTADKSLVFLTGGGTQSINERMRIDGLGNVGIGTTNPSTKLHVVGANPLTLMGVATGGSTINDSLLTINNGLVSKLPISTFGFGSVTSASVVTANGLAGTVSNPSTTPAITLRTTVSGIVKGNGTALSAATAGTDYAPGTAANATGIIRSTTGTGALTTAVAADFPVLNQNTLGNAATVTTNANLTGEITSVGNATTIATGVVTNAKLANMATATFKGRTTAGTGSPEDLTATQATAMLNTFGAAKGLVPAVSSNTTQFLRADGSFAVPPGTNTTTGTVTSASVVTANGISGTVATSTTTPAITLSLGAITPSSVAATGTVTGSNLSGTSSGANTGDETTATIKTKLGAATALADGYLTIADWNMFNSKPGSNSVWLLGGNGGTSPASHYIGTSDAQDVVFKANAIERMRIVNAVSPSTGTAGDITIGDATSGTIRSAKELVLRQDGDIFGSSSLRLRNRTNENGAIFETLGGTANLVDFIFRTGPILTPLTSNIRFEARPGSPNTKITGNTSEWQFGQPTNPSLVVNAGSSGNSALLLGNFGIGTANPSTKLHVVGANPLTLMGVAAGGSTINDSLLTISNGLVSKLPISTFGSGSVTSASVVTANGISGTVATPGTTPAITLTLGAITPTSVTASGSITGSNVLSTNASDIAGKVTGNTAITGATKTKITYDTKA